MRAAKVSPRKVAVVTGANRGLGYTVSKRLGAHNYHVVMTARNEKSLHSAVNKIRSEHPTSHYEGMRLDTSKADSIQHFSKELSAKYPKIDVLINNAGILQKEGKWTKEGFDETFRTNTWGPMLLTKTLLPLLQANEDGGLILNMSAKLGQARGFPKSYQDKMNALLANKDIDMDSLWKEFSTFEQEFSVKGPGQELKGGWATYVASKYALNVYTQILAHQLKVQAPKLFVYAIYPGWVKTDLGTEKAPLDQEAGTDTAVWLCEQGPEKAPFPSGAFLEARKEIRY